jgi:lysophospholipase L1-like esterase
MKNNLFAVLVGIIILAFVFGFFELFIRLVYPEVQPIYTNRELIKVNAFYDSNGLQPSSTGISHGVVINTDQYGFRLTVDKPDTSLSNWLYLGDSVTMGIGVATDHTFAYLADQRLRRIKVRNGGVIGHSTYDYVNAARHYTKQMDISRISIFYCLNDVYSRHKEQAIPGNQVREVGGGLLNFIKLNFRLYDVLKANLFDRPATYFEFAEQYYAKDNAIYLSALKDIRSIIEYCTEQNIALDIILMPYEFQLRNYDQKDIFKPQKMIKRDLVSDNINMYDCSEFILERGYNSQDLYLYGDGIHFSIYGHQLIQEYIISVILEGSDWLYVI